MAAAIRSTIKVSCVWEESATDVIVPPTAIKFEFYPGFIDSAISLSIGGVLGQKEKKPLKFHILKQDGFQGELESLDLTAQEINSITFRLNDTHEAKIEILDLPIEGIEYEIRIQSCLGRVLRPCFLVKEENVRNNIALAEQIHQKFTLWMMSIASIVRAVFHTDSYGKPSYVSVIYKAITQTDQRVLEEVKASLEKVNSENSFIDFCILAFNRGFLSKISLTLAESRIGREVTRAEQRAIGALTYKKIIELVGSDHSRRSQIQLLPGISLLG